MINTSELSCYIQDFVNILSLILYYFGAISDSEVSIHQVLRNPKQNFEYCNQHYNL